MVGGWFTLALCRRRLLFAVWERGEGKNGRGGKSDILRRHLAASRATPFPPPFLPSQSRHFEAGKEGRKKERTPDLFIIATEREQHHLAWEGGREGRKEGRREGCRRGGKEESHDSCSEPVVTFTRAPLNKELIWLQETEIPRQL